jgi:hypothetical protein
MAVGFYTWLVVGVIADVTIVLVALAAFQIAAIGLLAELINKRLPSAYRDDQ